MSTKRIDLIRERLQSALQPTHLEVIDESHLHIGHAGARDGRGHFRVRITSPLLAELRPLERHRKIYAALGELMETDIHALSVEIGN